MIKRTQIVFPRWRNLVLLLTAALLFSVPVFAQDQMCKSKSGDVKVAYPELAKRMKIGGLVRLQLQLTTTGTVREIKILGGNPILVSAAQDAVKQAKFEGTQSCVIVFEFKE